MNAWIPALLVFVSAVFGMLALVLVWEALRDWLRRMQTRRRLTSVVGSAPTSDETGTLIRVEEDGDGLLARLSEGVPFLRRIEVMLDQARLDIGVDTFLFMTLATAAGAGFAAWLLRAPLFVLGLAAAFGTVLPYMFVARKRRNRLRDFEEQFPEAIDLLTRAIRAGHPISSGMRMVSDEAPPVVAEEFRQAFEEQRFGLPFEDSLLNLVDRMNMVDVRIFATALLIQREVGGNLAEILDNLATTIRGRFYIRRQLRVYTAQGRMSAWILGLLPVVVAGVIHLMQPSYLSVLFDNPGGLALLGSAVILQILGVLWIRNIINIEI